MSNNGWFGFFYAGNNSGPSKEVAVPEASEDTVVPYDRFDFKEVTALMLDALFKDDFYDDTMTVLSRIPDLKASKVAILVNVDQQGLLVDGVKRGWHKEWISFECCDEDGKIEEEKSFRVTGWFYVQYDEQGKAQEPYLHYPETKGEIVKYYPTRHTWKFFESQFDDCAEESDDMYDFEVLDKEVSAKEVLYCVFITHTALPTDYVQFDIDEHNNVVHMFERYYGQPRLEVEFSAEGRVCGVTTFTQDVKGEDEELYRVYVQSAPSLDEIVDF